MRRLGFLMWGGVLLLAARAAAAEPPPIFTLTDPRGDDHGDGALVYPLRDDLHPGDLDLLSFSAYPDPDGTIFELTFARPLARPGPRAIDSLGTTIESVAKLGFYTLNVDIYIDTDRVPGSGLLSTLPGRKAQIDPAYAWEKAICLTPRPYEARSALKRMGRSPLLVELKGGKGAPSKGTVEERVFFPTRVWVTGSTLRFLVPGSFLGGTAKPSWSYVVAVTGADLAQRLDVQSLSPWDLGLPGNLALIPLIGGPSIDAFGGSREGDPLDPPLVDLLVPPGRSQEQILKDDDPQTGRPVRLPGVVPAEAKVPAPAERPPGKLGP